MGPELSGKNLVGGICPDSPESCAVESCDCQVDVRISERDPLIVPGEAAEMGVADQRRAIAHFGLAGELRRSRGSFQVE
jgi:hypothetical protein